MVQADEYKTSVSLFATRVEGVLATIESSSYTVLQSHINLLRLVVTFIQRELVKQSGDDIDPSAVFNIDTELHKIQGLALQLIVEDDTLKNPEERKNAKVNNVLSSLKALKGLINLAQLKVTLVDSIVIALDVLNKASLIKPKLNITDPDAQSEKLLAGFLDYCKSFADFTEGGFNLNIDFAKASSNDGKRISSVFSTLYSNILKGADQLSDFQNIQKILELLKKVAKSSKVEMLISSGGLDAGPKFMTQIDTEIIKIIYNGPDSVSFKNSIKVELAEPKEGEVLGEGLLGLVLAGTVKGKPAAFKTVDLSVTDKMSPEGRSELISELKILWAQFNHKNVLDLVGVSLTNNNLLIALEKMDASLHDVLYGKLEQELFPAAIAQISLDLASGLKFLHTNAVIHSALHPHNVLLSGFTKDGKIALNRLTVKLTDFGTKLLKRDLEAVALESNPELGKRVEGYQIYKAPEVLVDGKYTYASDVYALALVLWEVGQPGEKPFAGVSDLQSAVVEGKERPSVEAGKLTQWMQGLVYKAWAHEPWLRPTSAELQREIKKGKMKDEQAIQQRFEAQRGFGAGANMKPMRAQKVMRNLTFNQAQNGNNRKSGSRLSRMRRTIQSDHIRASSMSRNSVVLQKQKFGFLEEVDENSDPEVGIKIVRAMRFFVKDAELQVRAIVGIRKILSIPGREDVLARMGAGLAVLTAMDAHPGEVAVLEPACGAIANLCESPDVSEAMMRHGALQKVVKAMKDHSKDEMVIGEALAALSNLHSGELQRMEFLLENEAPDLIINALKTFPNSARVQSEGFAAVAYLQTGFYECKVPTKKLETAMKKKFRKKKIKFQDFYNRKAGDLIRAGMKKHSKDMSVQIEGCTALQALSVGFQSRKKALIGKKVVELVNNALLEFGDEPAMCEAAFSYLASFSKISSCHKDIIKLGLYKDVVAALREYTEEEDENLQFQGVMTLHGLAWHDKKSSKILKKYGGIEAGVRVKALYPENTVLTKKGAELATLVLRKGYI